MYYLPDTPQAILFLRSDGTPFQMLHNPTQNTSQSPLVFTNRPTADGIMTYPWALDVKKLNLEGISTETVNQWIFFRQMFQGQIVQYQNQMTGEKLKVLITEIDFTFDNQTPYQMKYTVQFQEANDTRTQGAYKPASVVAGPS